MSERSLVLDTCALIWLATGDRALSRAADRVTRGADRYQTMAITDQDALRTAPAGHRSARGLIHLYTGNGKGKTTAALGLALRALGAGLNVYIAHFAKARPTSEHTSLQRFGDLVTVRQYGRDSFIVDKPSPEDIACARAGFEEVSAVIRSGRHDLVILDECCIALHYGMIPSAELISLLKSRPTNVEVVITGRNAPADLIGFADLVTEMREVKHYAAQGVQARRGIEF